MGHALHHDQRLDAVAARLKRALGVTSLLKAGLRLLPMFDLVAALRSALCLVRGLNVGFASAGPLLRAGPVHGQTRWRGLLRQQDLGNVPVQQPRDGRGHRVSRGFEDQVVRESVLAKDLRHIKLMPGLGQVQRVQRKHRGGELGAEAGTRQRGHACELQRGRRKLRQAALHQRGHGAGLGQAPASARAAIPTVASAREHHVLQRFQRKHRVAAAVFEQRGGQCRRVQPGQRQRGDELGHLRQVEGRQAHGLQPLRVFERALQGDSRRAGFRRSQGKTPAQRAQVFRQAQRLQTLNAGVVGEVQVVHDQRVQTKRKRLRQRGLDRALQEQPLRVTGQRHGLAQLGQHQGQLLAPRSINGRAKARQQRTQKPRQQRVGQARVTRARLHAEHAVAGCRHITKQARLADAGLAVQGKRALAGPGLGQRGGLPSTAHQARRAHQAGRRDGTLRGQRQGDGTALDGR